MPTKKRGISHLPDNLPPQLDKPEETCPFIRTAERVFRDRPEVSHQCVQRLAEGASIRPMQKEKVSWHTIVTIRTREAKVISATKEHIRGVAVQLAIERLIDLMARDKIPPSAMPVATGILIDKHRLIEGEPSQTIEVKKTVSLEDVRGELDRIRRWEAEGVEVD